MEGGDLCMSSVDEKIVRMKFDNATFAQGVSSTMSMLQSLNKALQMEGASKGLNEVSDTVSRFNTAGAQEQVSAFAQKFTALQVAAITALSNIVNKAVDAGLQIAKSLSIAPIVSGFQEYETNLGSIQTILANTGLKGAEGLAKVNGALDQLNTYSDQTIYNFSEMSRNIGTFTAAGVSLDKSTQAIKGIANLAAISGSNSQQASTAMYQLSQALSAGKLSLEDWNSVVNAGMGGEIFRNSLIETARAHGVAVDAIIKKQGSFRDSLQEGWITSGILTETLSKFTGELTADQLKSMGYTQAQIKGIMEMARTATDAATKVKTMSQLMDTLREAVGSGWAKTWQIVFGNFDEAKDLFTGVNNVLGGMIQKSADARNQLLQQWKDLGGRQALIDGIANAFKALGSILTPIRNAFRDIFPATTAKQLYDMTVAFRDFMAKLKLGEETANNLRRTFAGFFAILGIGWELIKAGVKFIFDLVGSLTSGSGGFLKFTANIGDFLVALHQAIKDGDAFGKIFDFLAKVISYPINAIRTLSTLIGNLFKNADDGATAAKDSVGNMVDSLSPLERLGHMVQAVWERIQNIFSTVSEKVKTVAKDFIQWAKGVGSAISGVFEGGLNFDAILSAVDTGLFAGLVVLLKKFVTKFGNFKLDGGFLDGVKEAIEGLTGTLKGMQNALNAAALLGIAAAIGILTLSLIALSDMDAAGLARASAAIAVMFAQLGAAFVAFNKISSGGSAVKVGIMAAGLILLGVAVRILASAVEKLGSIPLDQLQRGLIALALLLGTLVAASNRLNTVAPGMLRTAAGLVILAAAVRLLVNSVEALGGMDWKSLSKGLVGVGTLLAALALFTKFAEADKGGITQGAGIVLLATGLKILASAVKDFTQFNWEQIARGMGAIGIGLGLITAAMNLLPEGSVFKAAGVLIVATALQLIAAGVERMSGLNWGEIARGMSVMAGALISIAVALRLIPSGSLLNAAAILVVATALGLIQDALDRMAGMSWGEIGKGLTVLAASLILIAGAIRVVQGALSGAAAIIVVATALNMLMPVLTTLGNMSWEEIIKGLVGLAGVFVIIGVATLVLQPLVPTIFALAVAIGLLSLSVLAAGLGVLAFATGLTVLGAAGTAAVAAIVGIVAGLVGLIPYVMEEIAKGLVAFAQIIATSGPAILSAITTLMNAFLDAVISVTPKIVQVIIDLLAQILQKLAAAVPGMTESGIRILVGFLSGVASKIGAVVDQGVRIIVALLDGIGRNASKIVQAGIDLLLSFLNAIADGVRNNSAKMVDAGWNIASALIEGVIKGVGELVHKAVESAVNVAKKMWDGITNFFSIFSPSRKMIWMSHMLVLGIANGLDKYGHVAVDATTDMSENMIDSMGKTLSGLSSVLGSDLIDFNPTIAPVLDLTEVKKEAQSLSDILSLPEFDVSRSTNSARSANNGFESNRTDDGSDTGTDGNGNTYNFTQNNTSPKALSEAEIYRQTKNLISNTKKGEG